MIIKDYTVLAYSCYVVSTLHFKYQAMPTNDTDYSCHIQELTNHIESMSGYIMPLVKLWGQTYTCTHTHEHTYVHTHARTHTHTHRDNYASLINCILKTRVHNKRVKRKSVEPIQSPINTLCKVAF